jgi:hypothetical protein
MRSLSTVAVRSERAVAVVTYDSRIFEFAGSMAFMTDGVIVRTEHGKRRKLPLLPASRSLATVELQGIP